MEYRNLRTKEVESVRDLFASYYDTNVYSIEPRYLEWLHRGNPNHQDCASEDELTIFGAIEEGRLLACINYVPCEIHVQGERHRGLCTVESLSRPEATGAYGLLAYRLSRKADYLFMMGATEFLRDLYVKQLGAQYCHEISRVVLIGDVAAVRRILERKVPPHHIEGTDRLEAWAAEARRLAEGATWVRIETAAELRGHYWESMLAAGIPCPRRDPTWLEWRYHRHPHIDYDVIACEATQAAGIAVVRRETPRDLDCEVLRLLEFLPVSGHEAGLAGAVARFAMDHGCAMVDFFCAHAGLVSTLPAAFIHPDDHLTHDIPYLLQPPEWRERRSINLLSVLNRRSRGRLPALAAGDVYITKGDGAQDVALDPGYRSAHTRAEP